MKSWLLVCCCGVTAVALAGCAEVRKSTGAASMNDKNVSTGGPVSGNTLSSLPEPVRNALRQKFTTAEVAKIDPRPSNGRTVYRIEFVSTGKRPVVYIAEDGTVVNNPADKPQTPSDTAGVQKKS